MSTTDGVYDRQAELRAFDATKAGVKGLVDSGITSVPRIFRHTADDQPIATASVSVQLPVIDLAGDPASVVDAVGRAAAEWGFFQVVGHGVPEEVMEAMMQGGRRFHEETGPAEKAAIYSRELGRKVMYLSNYKLFTASAADWRDTLYCIMAPEPPEPNDIPGVCRDALIEYKKHMTTLGETLFDLLSRALGLSSNRLSELKCNEGQAVLSHYYPPCPEPECTFGGSRHSDPNFLTILLQDQAGGLQVLHDDQWVDVQPTPGALVVNIGDLLQIMSNDKFISVEHRVLANKHLSRVSIACFFAVYSPTFHTILYGPIDELLSDENPPLYRKFSLPDYSATFAAKGHLRGRSALTDFKLGQYVGIV